MRRKNVGFNTSEKRLESKDKSSNKGSVRFKKEQKFWPPKDVIETEKNVVLEIINHEYFAKDYDSIRKVTEILDKYGGLEEYKNTFTFKYYFVQFTSGKGFQKKLKQRDKFILEASRSEGLSDITSQPNFIKKGIERFGGVDSFLIKLRSFENNVK